MNKPTNHELSLEESLTVAYKLPTESYFSEELFDLGTLPNQFVGSHDGIQVVVACTGRKVNSTTHHIHVNVDYEPHEDEDIDRRMQKETQMAAYSVRWRSNAESPLKDFFDYLSAEFEHYAATTRAQRRVDRVKKVRALLE